MKHVSAGSFALLAALVAAPAFAATEGIVLFTQSGAQILGANGAARAAKRGDMLQSGERLVTPPGGISQVRLSDGSLIGMKPGSELKFDLPPQTGDRAKHVVSLLHGALHVIGSDLMDASKPSELTLQTGLATVNVKGSDLESAVVAPPPPAAPAPAGATVQPLPTPVADIGSYSKLIVGAATISTGILPAAPLPVNQISFVGTTLNVAPVIVASVAPSVFNPVSAIGATVLPASGKTSAGTIASIPATNIVATSIAPATTTAAAGTGAANPLMPSLTTSTLSPSLSLGSAVGTSKSLGTIAVAPIVAPPSVGFTSLGTAVALPVAPTPSVGSVAVAVVAPPVIARVVVTPVLTYIPPATSTIVSATAVKNTVALKKVVLVP
jgi:hypothetical protein